MNRERYLARIERPILCAHEGRIMVAFDLRFGSRRIRYYLQPDRLGQFFQWIGVPVDREREDNLMAVLRGLMVALSVDGTTVTATDPADGAETPDGDHVRRIEQVDWGMFEDTVVFFLTLSDGSRFSVSSEALGRIGLDLGLEDGIDADGLTGRYVTVVRTGGLAAAADGLRLAG